MKSSTVSSTGWLDCKRTFVHFARHSAPSEPLEEKLAEQSLEIEASEIV